MTTSAVCNLKDDAAYAQQQGGLDADSDSSVADVCCIHVL
jgi:hypothetical protein